MNRLYQNGMLSTGEPRHFAAWDFPSLPRLQAIETPRDEASRVSEQWRKRGLARLLRDVLRTR